MGARTGISWTHHTWNPWRGCERISPGCAHCYMFHAQRRYGQDPGVIVRTKTWGDPSRWQRAAQRKNRTELVFTCSWSDFFHPHADTWRPEAWRVIRSTPNLIYQILTKRPENIPDRLPDDWGEGYPNVWLGVSVENQNYLWRVDVLRAIPARAHFISAEPLLARLPNLDLTDIELLIVGGESGPGYRPMEMDWVRELRAKARAVGSWFFFKQSAALRPGTGGDLLDDRLIAALTWVAR